MTLGDTKSYASRETANAAMHKYLGIRSIHFD
jgi:hypothetical protein